MRVYASPGLLTALWLLSLFPMLRQASLHSVTVIPAIGVPPLVYGSDVC